MNRQLHALGEGIKTIPFIWPILCSWRLIGICGLVGAAIVFVITLGMPDTYTAEVSILPHKQDSQLGMLGQFASLTGMAVGNSSSLEALYTKILESDKLLDELIGRRWAGADDDSAGIADVLVESGFDPNNQRQIHSLKRKFRLQCLHFSRDRISGFMTLSVTLPRRPELSAQVANHLVDSLEHFIRDYFVAKAREQRSFLESRLDVVESELHSVENALTAFVMNNQGYRASPPLLQQFSVLEREVSAQRTIWVELRQQLELARIEENKNLESLNILDRARTPTRPSGPHRLRYTVLAMVLGFVVGTWVVLVRERSPLYQ